MMTNGTSYRDLAGRGVLITGGATGIGAAMVRAFCAQGAIVVFLDVLDVEARRLVESSNTQYAGRADFIYCDLRDVQFLEESIHRGEEKCGGIHVLINNAGNDDRHELGKVTPEYWDERIRLNQRHMFFACQAIFPLMAKRRSGSIINFGSIISNIKQGDAPIYSMAKSSVHGLTRALARQFGAAGIRINTISPGATWTERQIRLWFTPEVEREIISGQCLKEKILPEDVAKLALFLASEESSKCTAQEFTIDAGWT